jgi:hypothetical protein
MPVQGILGNQAKAYLIYLEEQIQIAIDAKKLPYRIRLTLPSQADLSEAFPDYPQEKASVKTKEVDMTNHWRITNSDYSHFIDAVRDSLIREALYEGYDPEENIEINEETTGKMLKHPDVFYDEASMEWYEFDPASPDMNRELFPFDSDFNWRKKLTREQYLAVISKLFIVNGKLTELNYDRFDKGKSTYRFYWQDLKRRANVGDLYWSEYSQAYEPENGYDVNWNVRTKDFGNGIRRSDRYYHTIIFESTNVYPGVNCNGCNSLCYREHNDTYDTPVTEHLSRCKRCPDDYDKAANVEDYDFTTNPEALIQGLTYAQALAFYNWKFLNKNEPVDFDEIIYDELLPSEEEFQKFQAGEQFIKASEKITFPTPLFRYVVHVYAK